jgi:hypothetical protein
LVWGNLVGDLSLFLLALVFVTVAFSCSIGSLRPGLVGGGWRTKTPRENLRKTYEDLGKHGKNLWKNGESMKMWGNLDEQIEKS